MNQTEFEEQAIESSSYPESLAQLEPVSRPDLPGQLEPTSAPGSETRQRSFLLPALFFLFVGGLIGYVVGRQSAVRPAAEPAANAIVTPAPANPTIALSPVTETGTNATTAALTGGNDESGAVFSNAPAGPTPASISPETLRTLGDPNAPVTIVEFSDYQCPFCLRHFQETFPQLKAEYIDTGQVYYIFKDFPITSLHPVAPRVHQAARCAGEIGSRDAYWQVHDSFFNNQQQWADQPQPDLDNILVGLTNDLELSEPEMRECLASGRYTEAVTADLAEGQRLGVSGTPAFFINGYPLAGAQPYEVFQQAIDLAIQGRLGEAYALSAEGQAQATATALAGRPVYVPLGDAPALGSPDAPITIVEYSDYQCPFCLRHFQSTLPQLQAYIDADQVRYVFKDFPLYSIHPQAQKAHEGSRCARELGGDEAYWAMHDLLFANQEQWANNPDHVAVIKSLAVQAGLPQAEFDDCLDSGRYAEAVNADVAEGQGFGVNGTPTFFINGQRLVGAQPFPLFEQVIQAILADR